MPVNEKIEDIRSPTFKVLTTASSVLFFLLSCFQMIFSGVWLSSLQSYDYFFHFKFHDNVEDYELEVHSIVHRLQYLPIILLVISMTELPGCLLICCVSCCEFRMAMRTLRVYYIILLVVSPIVMYVANYQHHRFENNKDFLLKTLHERFKEHYVSQAILDLPRTRKSHAKFTYQMNFIQLSHKCCGVESYTDYEKAPMWTENNECHDVVPLTCCKLDVRRMLYKDQVVQMGSLCTTNPTVNNSHINKGCFDAIVDTIHSDISYACYYSLSVTTALAFLTVLLFTCQLRVINLRKNTLHIPLDMENMPEGMEFWVDTPEYLTSTQVDLDDGSGGLQVQNGPIGSKDELRSRKVSGQSLIIPDDVHRTSRIPSSVL